MITLTTDLGLKDYYVGAIKGAIFSQLPTACIVDITHELEPFDIMQASYVIKNSYPNFPQGTVHIIGIDAHPDINSPYTAVQINGQYFIGADNGIFSLLFDKVPDIVVELNLKQDVDTLNFPIRDIFAKAACHIARGGTLEVIGTLKKELKEKTILRPIANPTAIRGSIIYIDSYGNAITNITKGLFAETGKGRKYTIDITRYSISKISETYNDVVEGEMVAIFNSANHIELSINKGKIANLLNLHLGDIITVNFQ
ncbi:MAG: SAM-dependent chlorinase/fluorinase [Bacteroidetes bacterium]|nr:SAM-dependent chlorinase/fluorinase [Bacteroidota bacterium]